MSAFGWLLQPAVLPWVALALGLCIGSFLNVVIHRLPKMMEREWRARSGQLLPQGPLKEGSHNPRWARSRGPGGGDAAPARDELPPRRYLPPRGRSSAGGGPVGSQEP